MIENLVIKNIASFESKTGVSFNPTMINFIYGGNATGKTTISNVIVNPSDYPDCKVDWGLTTPFQALVYNKSFVEENFEQTSELKGIFTLGKESKTEIEKIRTNQIEVEAKDKLIIGFKTTLGQERVKLEELESNFTEKCWSIQKKYETQFVKAFEGFRGSKVRFKDKILSEFSSNKNPALPLSELETSAKAILNSDASKIPEIKELKTIDFNDLETNPIFKTRIIGKEDVDIAKMILKLNNSDWVRQGIQYFKANDKICPFCQQNTSDEFTKQLSDYFDETYIHQVQNLKNAKEKYELESEAFLISISNYLEFKNQFIDNELLDRIRVLISSIIDKNRLLLERKANEPTIKIDLENISQHSEKLKELIDTAISNIKKHNNLIDNISTERAKLVTSIWAYIIDELKLDYETYLKDSEGIKKAIKSLEDKISDAEGEIRLRKQAIQESENKITSFKPTIDAINRILSGFGFTNFSVAESSKTGFYKIVREDGKDAKGTLSEGEKNFITFLYFYHLANGSFETSNITNNKILVIDDPISSLDSSVLFIVSNLVRHLINECRSGTGNIKQVFILTHNVYFHKEVTFKKRSESNRSESFWILRKIGNISTIENYPDNPVQTSYDLLWQEIRDPKNINHVTVYNTLRRILEYYFKILGRIKDDRLLDKFEGEEKIISNSLLSWINEGSHIVNDDIFVATDRETIDKYLKAFKKIFEVENQIEHYNMMMKIQ